MNMINWVSKVRGQIFRFDIFEISASSIDIKEGQLPKKEKGDTPYKSLNSR
ncbi:MAG: hypothetical protein AB1567_03050 [bacterium]